MSSDLQDKYVLQFDSKEIYFLKIGGQHSRSYEKGIFYEAQMLAYIRFLGLKGRYLDIGGCMANHTVFFSRFCPATSVEIFEPLQECCEIIQSHIDVNNLCNVNLHKTGLGNEVKEVTTSFGKETVTFRTELLDSFNFSDIVVIKMDIEGMEQECLMGARETLIRNSPLIFMEAHTEDDILKQKSVLEPLGYKMTGKVWNASPTYEWVKEDSVLSHVLITNYGDITAQPVFSNAGSPRKCPICGGKWFISGPLGWRVNNYPPRCKRCESLERHRIVFQVWEAVRQVIDLSGLSCLQFSHDRSISQKWFSTCSVSVYGGENSIDIQKIPYDSGTWDVVVCNHVLEHIADDILALKELARILKSDGILQITVSDPMTLAVTDEWGSPDPNRHEHYRHYGRDIVKKFYAAFPGGYLFYVIGFDPITRARDVVFFLSKNKDLKRLGEILSTGRCQRLKPDSVINLEEEQSPVISQARRSWGDFLKLPATMARLWKLLKKRKATKQS